MPAVVPRLAAVLALAMLMAVASHRAEADPRAIRYAILGSAELVEASDDRTTPDTPMAVASVGKTFTAVAVLRLVERGAFSVETPAADLLPDAIVRGFGGLGGITLGHLLTMTSGLPDFYTDDYIEDALEDQASVQRADVAATYAMDEDRLFAPGRRFDYSNTNYLLLGMILERVTGESYGAVLEAEVFRPADMQGSFVFGTRALPEDFARGHPERAVLRHYYSGAGFGDGGVIAPARDVARFYRALFSEGRLLSAEMVALMLTDPLGSGYGMGIEIEDGIAGHSGGDLGHASDVRMDLRTGDVAVELIADEDAWPDWPDAILGGR
ncbi:serine hydrolase domain-containing protein [Histidinibacterium lentulum]|uniref:Class A beta-lactamase-related serine hydrolase n=1 Tax=Histidinibacterium lentulum TaxID=2480588 RepID=A0A3N2QW15_9RHOB|nr:serine hydrolase domain-containing protein [Histidinibacterium lentulum]ROT99428.1 class A beta-lactamase-related serine hydrolase [Histidinibacterium lentulum]